MPRLSVDIDLTYLPVADRQSSLEGINDALGRIMVAIARRNPRIASLRSGVATTVRMGGYVE